MSPSRPFPRRLAVGARLIAAPLLVALVLAGLHVAAMFREPPGLSLELFGWFTMLVLAIAWGIHAISRLFDRLWPWRRGRARRVLLQSAASLAFACALLMAVYVPVKLAEIAAGSNDVLAWPHIAVNLLIALLLGTALLALQLLFDLLAQWRDAEGEAERQREAALRAELDALRAQLDPHFLFNGLNGVHGLIERDPALARDVVLELSDVLRYVLRHSASDRVTLADELAFVDAWLAVIRARHGGQPQLDVDGLGDTAAVSVPPMSMQLLVENVVRHNRIDTESGMRIVVRREHDALIVSNPRLPRRDSAGAGTGLEQLDARLRLLGAPALRIERTGDAFRVALPLLP